MAKPIFPIFPNLTVAIAATRRPRLSQRRLGSSLFSSKKFKYFHMLEHSQALLRPLFCNFSQTFCKFSNVQTLLQHPHPYFSPKIKAPLPKVYVFTGIFASKTTIFPFYFLIYYPRFCFKNDGTFTEYPASSIEHRRHFYLLYLYLLFSPPPLKCA